VLLQVVPWYLRLFIFTLQVNTTDGRTVLPAATDYRPAQERAHLHLLDLEQLVLRHLRRDPVRVDAGSVRCMQPPCILYECE
jgi:hypothetical protein